MKRKALIVEDDPAMSLILSEYLSDEGLDIHAVTSGHEAVDSIKGDQPAVILLDLNLPDVDGIEFIQDIHRICKSCEVIVVTGEKAADSATRALQYGARDYLVKPVEKERLTTTVKNALQCFELHQQIAEYQKSLEQENFHGFIGQSTASRALYKTLEAAAGSNKPVFIRGERGAGKSLCAQAIHEISTQNADPFIHFNCSSIQAENIDHNIFGLEGVLSRAEGGTLFLDEVCDIDHEAQKKLLQFIETERFEDTGRSASEVDNVRIICSTAKDPLGEIEVGRFREDLYYHLHVLSVEVPPLRERGGDIILLAQYFLEKYGKEENKDFQGFEESVKKIFEGYHWPGNAKEIQNVVRNITVMEDGGVVRFSMIPNEIQGAELEIEKYSDNGSATTNLFSGQKIIPIGELEKMAIKHALEACNGNVQKAAYHLKISPATLYRKKPSA